MGITRRDLLLGAGCAIAGSAAGAVFSAGRAWRKHSDVPRVLQVPTENTLPAEVDVVVIGGGIGGLSSALFLAEKGLRTIVLEKGLVGGEQSGRAFGWVYSNGWHPEKLELANRSKEIWSGFSERFGEDVGFRQEGNFTLISSDEEMEFNKQWLSSALAVQPKMDAKIVTGTALDALIPGASKKYLGAVYQASDGGAEPTFSISKIAMGTIRQGVRIIAPCAARTIERQAGRVAGVHTELGYVRTKYVVLSAGVWSSLFARNAGVPFAQLAINAQMQRLSQVTGPLPGAGFGPDYAWRRMINGETSIGSFANVAAITTDSFRYFADFMPALKHTSGIIDIKLGRDFFESMLMTTRWGANDITPFEQSRMLSGTVNHQIADSELANFRRAHSQYERAVVKERWAGMIDTTPDSTPTIGEVPNFPGLFLNTGYSAYGFTLGPGSGEMVAQMISGEKTTCSPSVYRYNRFTDGSELVFRH